MHSIFTDLLVLQIVLLVVIDKLIKELILIKLIKFSEN